MMKVLSEGKTKRILSLEGDEINDLVILEAKDDITAGDGAKHDIIPDKGRLATTTTCNVFKLLKACGLPVAFVAQDSPTSFKAANCKMIPLEVVVRREAHGSYLKRNPHIAKGQVFPKLIVEFYLKTKDKTWIGDKIPCDDPLIAWNEDSTPTIEQLTAPKLYVPNKPIYSQEPFSVVNLMGVCGVDEANKVQMKMYSMGQIARQAFLILEKAWQLQGRKLVDFKVEFGYGPKGELLLADVIDNDSWRVIEDGAYIDKQVYRDGGGLGTVVEKYRLVARLTENFGLPSQSIIAWRGSNSDNISEFIHEVDALTMSTTKVSQVTCSAHKKPMKSVLGIQGLVQDCPQSVLVTFVGLSNGAGPMLSTQVSIPSFTVPKGGEDRANDVWSSLSLPSNVPVATILRQKNAALAAVQVLAMTNPFLYMRLRLDQEENLSNYVPLV